MTTDNARLRVVPETLTRNSSGAITGEVWLAIGGWGFPASNWDDFALAVIADWADALSHIIRYRRRALVCFHDGPYEVELNPVTTATIALRANQPAGIEHRVVWCSPLAESVVEAAELALAECAARRWEHSSVKALQCALTDLRTCLRGPADWHA